MHLHGFLVDRLVVIRHFAGQRDAHRADCIIDISDRIADDDLGLPALLHDGQNAFGLLETLHIGLTVILQLEAQPRSAMGKRDDVLWTAYKLDYRLSALLILCHVFPIWLDSPAYPEHSLFHCADEQTCLLGMRLPPGMRDACQTEAVHDQWDKRLITHYAPQLLLSG